MTMESDDELRRRLAYIAIDAGVFRLLPTGDYLAREISTAQGSQLDEIADRFSLRRRWM